MEEPTGNLDTESSHDVMGLLKMAAMQYQQTIVLITHDHDIAQKANEVMVTKDVLKDCGMGQLNVGDSFTITYGDNLGEHTKGLVI